MLKNVFKMKKLMIILLILKAQHAQIFNYLIQKENVLSYLKKVLKLKQVN